LHSQTQSSSSAKADDPVFQRRSLSKTDVPAYWVARSSRAMTMLLAITVVLAAATVPSMLRHHAPFGDHGFAHLAGLLGAGDLVDLQRDLLADKSLQLRRLGIIVGHDLKCLRSGLEIAEPARRRQPVRFADELEGVDALALGAAAHGVELPGHDIAVLDRLLHLRVKRACLHDRQNSRSQRRQFTEVASRHVSSDSSFKTTCAAAWLRTGFLHRYNRARRRPARHGQASLP